MSRADTGEQKSMSGRDKCPEGDKGNGSSSSGRRKADRVWLRSARGHKSWMDPDSYLQGPQTGDAQS